MKLYFVLIHPVPAVAGVVLNMLVTCVFHFYAHDQSCVDVGKKPVERVGLCLEILLVSKVKFKFSFNQQPLPD